MRNQTEGSIVTAVMKREFHTHKIITLPFLCLHSFLRNDGKVEIKSHEDKNLSKSRVNDLLAQFI